MNLPTNKRLVVRDLGLIDYEVAYSMQQDIVREVIKGADECLVLCEHPPVITLGRVAKQENIYPSDPSLSAYGIKRVSVDRGGDVTLHAPGQLVAYPILDLKRHKTDLHFYIREIEQVAIDFLGDFGILAFRNLGYTGVWVDQKKIASIGIAVRKWVTYHGIAINLNVDLDLFSLIRPCGLDVEITSVHEILNREISLPAAKDALIDKFHRKFKFQTVEGNIPCLMKN